MSQKFFIDLFSGCGGLSLGLKNAGWQGIFAIEKTPDAFKTLKHNLIDKSVVNPFAWPEWLPCKEMTTSDLIDNYSNELKSLQGKVDLIAGGPPCQGFSFAGRRNAEDPRNKLTEEYIQVVKLIQPQYLLLENVKGFKAPFKNLKTKDKNKVYAEVVKEKIEAIGYQVFYKIVNASSFGVPQPRPRFIMIAVRGGNLNESFPFKLLEEFLPEYRINKGLNAEKITSVKDAISDLEIGSSDLIPSVDTNLFKQIKYSPKKLTAYQKLMRKKCSKSDVPNSLRLARHNPNTLDRFNKVMHGDYIKGKSLDKSQLEKLGTKKRSFTPLHPDQLSSTITTLPDDLMHYSEARILTVRENARIQSFPDWFEFQGKYTTGGARRKEESPRYSQVGNAVPPLMAEALGQIIMKLGDSHE